MNNDWISQPLTKEGAELLLAEIDGCEAWTVQAFDCMMIGAWRAGAYSFGDWIQKKRSQHVLRRYRRRRARHRNRL